MTEGMPPPAPEAPREPEKPPEPPIEVRAQPYEPRQEPGARTFDAPPPKSPPPPPPSGGGFASGAAGFGSGPAAPTPPPAPAAKSNGWAVFCHLGTLVDFSMPWFLVGWIPPLVIWLAKKDEDPEIDYHGRESLNFQLNLIFWAIAAFPLICLCGVGIAIAFLLPFVKLVLVLIASIRAADGERFRYPYIFRIL